MDIIDYPNYLIYPDGKVWSKNSNRFMKYWLSKPGYCFIKLANDKFKNGKRKSFSVHRLVAIHYINNPTNLSDVNHIDGNKTNNNVDNLEWLSHSDNKNRFQKNTRPGQIKNIHRNRTAWTFEKTYYGKRYKYFSPNKINCICYKFIFHLKVKAGLFKK